MLKRVFDIILSSIILIALLSFGIILVLLIYIKLGSPVIFKQDRAGKDGRIFTMYKFRTMLDIKDNKGELLPDDERLTSFGRMLRSTSLDEIPELFNVIKGDMSLVGPRPLLISYLDIYSERQKKRHNVRPGITGLAQVNGRNSISWAQRFEIDVWYVENRTFWMDIKILFMTIKKVFIREGISPDGSVTMEMFNGKN